MGVLLETKNDVNFDPEWPIQTQERSKAEWFDVILAAGHFAVRACGEDDAAAKTQKYSESLRQSRINIDVGAGLPLITNMSADESYQYETVWFDDKPDVALLGLREDTSHLISPPNTPRVKPVDGQLELYST